MDGWPKGAYDRQLYHDDLFSLVRAEEKFNAETASRLVTMILDQADHGGWHYWWSNPDHFLKEVRGVFQAILLKELSEGL